MLSQQDWIGRYKDIENSYKENNGSKSCAERLKEAIHEGPRIISRSPETQQAYLLRQQVSHELLGGVTPYIQAQTSPLSPIRLVKNSFSYALKENCYHYLLWVSKDLVAKNQFNQERALSLALSIFANRNIAVFRQPTINQSIPAVPHWHIFVEKGALSHSSRNLEALLLA